MRKRMIAVRQAYRFRWKVGPLAVRNLVKQADRFFSQLPYSSIETTSIELSGRL